MYSLIACLLSSSGDYGNTLDIGFAGMGEIIENIDF